MELKAKNKAAFQKQLGLPCREDTMMIGVVSRLTRQKGFQLLISEIENLLQFDVQLVILGTGDADFEGHLKYIAQKYPDKCCTLIDFNFDLAQKIYGSCDLFLMPSAFEPCGLSQMIAMRYGTIPLVHEIGGLKDTVIPYDPTTNEGTGFGFVDFSSFVLMETIKEALWVYQHNNEVWNQIIQRGMAKDFSWKTASQGYQELYVQLSK